MIDIVTEKDRNLKNLKQIGTPREENKIYIENFAYAKLKENSFREKRVYVLMGHTERMEGQYATFVESVIPVKDIEFSAGAPRWNNGVWSEVFREIKHLYEDMIIVGWAIDMKGMSPRISPELERVHREHFGGVHQLLFLLDSLECEETFYIYRENKVVAKDGFYIYRRARKREEADLEIGKDNHVARERRVSVYDMPKKEQEISLDVSELEGRKGGRYRQMLQENQHPKEGNGGNVGLSIAVAMLLLVIGMGVYDNREMFLQNNKSIEVNAVPEQTSTETGIIIEGVDDTEVSVEEEEQATETVGDVIPIEVISGQERQE